jgi:hypothetical protein
MHASEDGSEMEMELKVLDTLARPCPCPCNENDILKDDLRYYAQFAAYLTHLL